MRCRSSLQALAGYLILCGVLQSGTHALALSNSPPAGNAAGNTASTPQTGEPTEPTAASASAPTASGVAPGAITPKIVSIVPAAPAVVPNQPLTLTGSGFEDGVTVAFIDPQNNSYAAKVVSREPERLVVLATLGSMGKWKVTAENPGGKSSEAFPFNVANSPALDFKSPQFVAFGIATAVATVLLALLIVFSVLGISGAEKNGWSLGEALSEESTYQPNEIHSKNDVIVSASTSRVIALIGLMGILSIVVGMGYAVIWNLTIYGTVPDLSEVRSFLYGASCLFAPYLANQVRGIFKGSRKAKPGASTSSQATTCITGIAPASPLAHEAARAMHVTGTGFQAGLAVIFTDPLSGVRPVAAADVTGVAATLVSINAVLDIPGSWKVTVANPATAAVAPFAFTVLGAPTINSAGPAPLTNNTAAQKVTFGGRGFISGLTVQLAPPAPAGGGAAPAPFTLPADQVTAQEVTVNAVLGNAGQWQAVITNPGNHASAAYNFNVG